MFGKFYGLPSLSWRDAVHDLIASNASGFTFADLYHDKAHPNGYNGHRWALSQVQLCNVDAPRWSRVAAEVHVQCHLHADINLMLASPHGRSSKAGGLEYMNAAVLIPLDLDQTEAPSQDFEDEASTPIAKLAGTFRTS